MNGDAQYQVGIEQRESRLFWAYHDNDVREVEGLDCGPFYEGKTWWVPELGYSLNLGAQLFDSEKEALEVGLKEMTGTIKRLSEQRDALAVRHALIG